jgi:HEXXH motif-containing protein
MLMLRYVVALAEELGHPQAAAIRTAYRTMSNIHRFFPHTVEALVRQPAVGAWASKTVRNLTEESTDGASPERLMVIAAAAAIRARYPYRARAQVVDGTVVIPSLGHVVFDDDADGEEAVINVTESGTEVSAAGSRIMVPVSLRSACGWRPLPTLAVAAGGISFRVLVDDIDPYRFSTHLLSNGQLTISDLKKWHALLSEAWQILVLHHRMVADELGAMIVAFTPLERPSVLIGRSATSPDSFGCIALSRPLSGLSLAMTLAHEIQHSKLAAILDLVDLLPPDTGARFYAPWRDDPRPAYALLHGAYAHLGVAAFCRQQREFCASNEALSMHRDYVRWREAVSNSVNVLAVESDLTDVGRQFISGMQGTIRSWQDDQVPPVAKQLARAAADSHHTRWRLSHLDQVGEGSKSQSSR